MTTPFAHTSPRSEDIPRIAFVTERFHELQGLRTVADALPALILAAGFHRAQSNLNVIVLFCALAAYFALRVTWIRSGIDDYYSRRLGRVDRSAPAPDGRLLFSQPRRLGWVDPSARSVEGIFLFYQGLIFAPMFRDSHLPIALQVLLIASMLGFPPVSILIRDWPYRIHWVLPLGVGLTFAFRLGMVASSQQLAAWQVLACLGSGVALAVAGVGDHLLLAKSLGGGAGARSTGEYVDIH